MRGKETHLLAETVRPEDRLINRCYRVIHDQTAKYYCRIYRDCRNHSIVFLCPFWSHLALEEEIQTDLSDSKSCVKSLKGANESVSTLGLWKSQHLVKNNKTKKMPMGL